VGGSWEVRHDADFLLEELQLVHGEGSAMVRLLPLFCFGSAPGTRQRGGPTVFAFGHLGGTGQGEGLLDVGLAIRALVRGVSGHLDRDVETEALAPVDDAKGASAHHAAQLDVLLL